MEIKIVKLEAKRSGFRVGQVHVVRRLQAGDDCRREGVFVTSPSAPWEYSFLAATEYETAR